MCHQPVEVRCALVAIAPERFGPHDVAHLEREVIIHRPGIIVEPRLLLQIGAACINDTAGVCGRAATGESVDRENIRTGLARLDCSACPGATETHDQYVGLIVPF